MAKIIVFISILIFFVQLSFSQTAMILVFDKETKQSVPLAHISFENLQSQTKHAIVSSLNGQTENTVNQKSIITISFLGYQTIRDTIYPKESKNYYLEQDVFLLDQLVVTATRSKKALKDAPILTQVITAKQIEARGFNTLKDVLESEMPSIEFQRQGLTNVMYMQGVDARNILILIDGERMAGETNGNVDYSRLNTNDIERIEIIKGAASALYGSQAMGAVINIISKSSMQKFYVDVSSNYTSSHQSNFPSLTKEDDFYQFKKNLDKINANISSTFGFRVKNFSSKTNFVLKNTDGYQLSDRSLHTKNFVTLDTVVREVLNENPIGIEGLKDYSISQKITYKFNEKINIVANGSYYGHHKYDFVRDNKHDFYDDISYGLKISYADNKERSLSFSYRSDEYNKYNYFEKLANKTKTFDYHLINPKLFGSHRLDKRNLLLGGFEYLHQSLEADIFVPGQVEEKQVSSLQLFVQDDITINARTNIIAGIRGEHHATYGTHFTPKISFMHKLVPLSFRLNYASGFRSPSLKELYYNWNLLGILILKGDENLKPETNNYFSGSVEFSKSRINTSISFYKNYFKNKIAGQWEDNQTIFQFTNFDKSELTGIDFLLKLKLHKSFLVKTAFSYVKDKNSSESVRLTAVSPYTGNAQVEYKFTKENYELIANVSGKYFGAKDFNILEEITYRGEAVEAYYLSHFDAYTMWNFTLSQNFHHSLNLVVGVNNIFDYTAEVITFNTSINPGRQYFVKLGISIDELYRKLF